MRRPAWARGKRLSDARQARETRLVLFHNAELLRDLIEGKYRWPMKPELVLMKPEEP